MKNFNKIEINYPGGPNISIYLDRGELKMGVHFSRDRQTRLPLRVLYDTTALPALNIPTYTRTYII